MPLEAFHPAVAAWFAATFEAPTPAQAAAWPAIASGRHTLVAAPTGSGKTLTGFLAAIDALVRRGLQDRGLPDETAVVYVSPLKALSNDVRLNLEAPLEGIRAELARQGLPDVEIRTAVRTGDTPQAERARLWKRPPHVLVTTPESLYVLLGSESGRNMMRTARTVIVDEIHAVAASKRGSHLALSLERLDALCGERLTRIGLSATQKPIEAVARFLVGTAHVAADGTPDCHVVDVGHARRRDLGIEVPPLPLEAVMSNEAWELVYDRLAALVRAHRTTLVFVNTRRMAERVARHLAERLGKDAVDAHHGSLAREHRLEAEQRLKSGALRVLVATASLELGIDIGEVDLVCQMSSPRAIAALLQRVGRSGHSVGGTPKGRLFPSSRDDLVECVALLDSVQRGELDALAIPQAPLDVLSQQIVAEVACQAWTEDALFATFTRAWPYAGLARADFDAVVRSLADGFGTRHGSRAYLHRDAVHGRLRGRRGARMTALTSGGTIPDMADYAVMLEPAGLNIGTVNEDFAVESMGGDIFQLGNASYRVIKVEPGTVRVEDAQGLPPSIPFWIGEAPGRSDELSASVSRLRAGVDAALADGIDAAIAGLRAIEGVEEAAARQVAEHLAGARAALGVVPTQQTLVLERFFDESGGAQLVIHSPYGSRINRAWGLALRKRFCRKFNFELQAAATEDAIVLSLSTSHSFPLAEVGHYLHASTAREVLVQALLDAPLFGVRWRWNATTALALPRFSGGRKVAPQIQRMRSEDLLAGVFPDQVACFENLAGERQVPDHPLVAQTLHDCLGEAMDVEGWLALLRGLESGAITILARDLAAPSPLAAEILSARPYAFLDDAPLEERRTQAVMQRRYADPQSAGDLGRLDAGAIASVRGEAWPTPRDADEMHDALMMLGVVTAAEAGGEGWTALLESLAGEGRATRVCPAGPDEAASHHDRGHRPLPQRSDAAQGSLPAGSDSARQAGGAAAEQCGSGPRRRSGTPQEDAVLWCAAERLPQLQELHSGATLDPPITAPGEFARQPWSREDALVELVRSRLSGLGPTPPDALAATLQCPRGDIDIALAALEAEGYAMRGDFSGGGAEEWCERHLLARIHRYTIGRLRREIEPVAPRDFMRFLFEWQHVGPGARVSGPDALAGVLAQLEGYEAAAAAWESELLPARVSDYSIHWLDELNQSGRLTWGRLSGGGGGAPVRATPVVLAPRRSFAVWSALAAREEGDVQLSSRAQRVLDHLQAHGASFFEELLQDTHLLAAELEDALGELVARGRVNADAFAGLRALLLPASKRRTPGGRRGRGRRALFGIEDAGRWALLRRAAPAARDPGHVEHVARVLLRRYGVVCWRLLEREPDWLPPWRELVRVYHRLEARGEIRGGRFVAGLSGEQFALPEAVGLLRSVRGRGDEGRLVCVSGADPLNLVGTLLPGAKLPRIAGARVLYRDGVPVATFAGDKVEQLVTLDADDAQAVRRALLRQDLPSPVPRPAQPA